MANMEELYAALQAADAAGNTDDARQLADYIRQIGSKKPQKEAPSKDISLGERFKDVGAGVVSGVGALAQLPGQLSGLAGLTELDDTGLQGAGKRLQEYGQEMKSAGLKAREQERTAKIKEAEKTGQLSAATTAFSETIKDPALLLSFLAEQAPQLVVPFGAAKGAAALTGAKALGKGLAAEEAALAAGRAGTKAAVGTGAVQQGADIGAGAYENIYAELIDKGAEPADAKQSALNLARAAGASGAIISLLAQRLPGAKSMEEAFAGVPGTGGRLAGAVTAGLGESLGEVAEETGGRFSQNLAMRDVRPEQSLTEGLGETAGMAAVGGVGMGGISGALRRQAQGDTTQPTPEIAPEEESAPLALGMNEPFVPVGLPDGSVANTPAELDAYRQQQEFGENLLAQPADERSPNFEDMTPAGAQEAARMAGFTGAPNANMSMMEQARASREAQAKAAEVARKKQIKEIQAATFHAEPIRNQQIKDQMLAELGVTPVQAKAIAAEKSTVEPPAFVEATGEQRLNKDQAAQFFEDKSWKEERDFEKKPYSQEELADISGAREALKDVNAQIEKAKSEGTDLFNRLKGVLPADEVHNILPEEKKGRVGTLASKTTGTPLSSLVADGSLNEFLPPDMRITSPGQDEMPGVEYITQAIQSGDTKSFDSKTALTQLEKAKQELKARLEQPSIERDANLKLGQVAEEQAGVEGLPTDALVEYAQTLGIDTEGIAQNVAVQNENMNAEQYHGEVRNALISAVNGSTGTETLASSEQGGETTEATKEELQMQKDLEGKTLIQAAQYAVDKAPDNFRKFVAQKVLNVLKSMQAAGVNFNFEVQGGKSRSSDLYDARGLATFVYGQNGNATSVVVLLNGTPALKNQLGYPSGMNYTTLLHELLHVATRMKVNFLDKSSPEVKALNDLYKTVVNEFNRQAKRKMLPPVLEKYYKRMNNALANADELMTWGMTDIDMQSWLSQIKVGEKTLMDKFVELARKILGISKPFETAFDRLVRTTDSILDIDVKTLANGMESYKYSLGPAKSKGKASPQQQSLFSKRAQELFGEKNVQKITNLPAFKRWFKDSKVVDANGKPMVVYHGTSSDVAEFSMKHRREDQGTDQYGPGYYTTTSPSGAGAYANGEGANIIPLFVSMQNPINVDTPSYGRSVVEKLMRASPDFKDVIYNFGDVNYSGEQKVVRGAVDAFEGYEDAISQLGVLQRDFWPNNPEGFLETAKKITGNDGVVVENQDGSKFFISWTPTQLKSTFNEGTFDKSNVEILKQRDGNKQAEATPTGAGVDSMRILEAMGRGNQEAEPGYAQKIRQAWDNARDNPKTTAEAAKKATTSFLDRVETWTFSSDAGLNNRIRREIEDSTMSSQEKIGTLLNTSLSQTVHSDAVASLFLQRGGIKYNNELHKWEGVDNASNFVKLSTQLDELADKNGLTKQQAELVAHTAFEAKRLRSLVRFNEELDDKIATVKKEAAAKRSSSPVAASALSKEAARLKDQRKFISDEQMDMIAPGMELFKIHPELNDVVKTWNEIRTSTVKTLVDTGLWSENEAEEMLSNADYVPFYREDQLENNQGPKEFIRGLQVQAKEKRLKGSNRPVNDIFDNQVRWVQYSINRAVRNRSALALADTAVEVGAAKKVESRSDGDNVVRVWRNGEEQFYSMDDPMFMEAFTGLEAIVIPSWKWAANMANVLRQSVVMYPLFSVAQVPQDSFAAIFSSGLKPQYALRIPVLAVKEFVQTLRGKSKTHEELKNVGAVGVRDFTSAMVRLDAEIYAGLKAPPGVLGKIKYGLNHIAMAADNAVRQAVYEASMSQGLSRAEAMEKAFEVFNVRRKGSSKSLALAGQLIPFFNAYLAAQNVAYKTITGRGISPTERQDAFKTLAATTASVMVLSLMYAMLNGDDEDYLKKPATQRDKLLMIPGTGMSVPLRADLFTMPKIITEHMYLMMTDKGYEDGRKFRDSMAAALGSAVLGPTAVPQAIKPLVEVGINYDFFQGRPLVGTYQQKLDTERQFTDSTSELGKILGKTGLVSPIAADHLLRGMFGSAGGLIIYATNPMLHSDPNTPRPSLSEKDAIATLPGMGGFMAKSYESALKKDFYTLKEEVDKAANTMNDLKTRSPQEIQSFLADEKNMARVGLQKSVNAVGERLSNIRKAITQTTNSSMPADEKQRQIKILRDAEEQMLQGVNVKMLRELGKI